MSLRGSAGLSESSDPILVTLRNCCSLVNYVALCYVALVLKAPETSSWVVPESGSKVGQM